MLTLCLGLSICPDTSANCSADRTWANSLPFTTEIHVSYRTSDVTYSLENNSIISVSNLSEPTVERISPNVLYIGLEAILGLPNSNPVSPIEYDPGGAQASLLALLWNTFNGREESSIGGDGGAIIDVFRALLALPIILFEVNGNNRDFATNPDQLAAGLPSELYVTVDLTKSSTRPIIPLWTAIVYTTIAMLLYIWSMGCLFSTLFIVSPPSSPFEAVDFASRVVAKKKNNELEKKMEKLSLGYPGDIRRELQKTVIFAREV
jgi:hypothetical protein